MFHNTCVIACFEKQNQNKHFYTILKNIRLSSSKQPTKVHRLAHCFINSVSFLVQECATSMYKLL